MTKLSIAVAAVSFVASFACAYAQSERLRGKGRDLKRQVESNPANQPPPAVSMPSQAGK